MSKLFFTLTNRSLFVSKKPMPYTVEQGTVADLYSAYMTGIKDPSNKVANSSVYVEIEQAEQLNAVFTLFEYHVQRLAKKSHLLDDAVKSGKLISMTGEGDNVVFGILADKSKYELVTPEEAIKILTK